MYEIIVYIPLYLRIVVDLPRPIVAPRKITSSAKKMAKSTARQDTAQLHVHLAIFAALR